jgi:bifunctional UDP-N-acetylglucosamine pyrophosphorylase / glucosamine-1-phosphate N-acetyltransferase
MAEANKLSVIILAAGNGKRMHSALPKVLHCLAGIPLLQHVVQTAQSLKPDAIYIVYGYGGEQVKEQFPDLAVTWVKQAQQQGTGHAVRQVLPLIADDHNILVLYGDVPLIKETTLKQLLTATLERQLGLLVATVPEPYGFGRIIRNNNNEVLAIVEQKDATEEQRQIQEINTGILTGPAKFFKTWLPTLSNQNAQGEYYLTDIVALAVKDNIKVNTITASSSKEISGVNDRKELIALERYHQKAKAQALLLQCVTIMDPARFDCRGELAVAKDVFIDINVVLLGKVSIAEGTTIGPNNYLKNVCLGKNVTLLPNNVLEDAIIGDNCIIGPFARIRPKTTLHENVHIGNFVEVKNSTIGKASKANHLTYLGDAIIGEKVNVGAGTITCNYDGVHKFPTQIADGAFIGSGTELVAPVKVGEGAYIGAGSTITRDAPAAELTLARAKQVTVKGWKPR